MEFAVQYLADDDTFGKWIAECMKKNSNILPVSLKVVLFYDGFGKNIVSLNVRDLNAVIKDGKVDNLIQTAVNVSLFMKDHIKLVKKSVKFVQIGQIKIEKMIPQIQCSMDFDKFITNFNCEVRKRFTACLENCSKDINGCLEKLFVRTSGPEIKILQNACNSRVLRIHPINIVIEIAAESGESICLYTTLVDVNQALNPDGMEKHVQGVMNMIVGAHIHLHILYGAKRSKIKKFELDPFQQTSLPSSSPPSSSTKTAWFFVKTTTSKLKNEVMKRITAHDFFRE